MDVQILVGGFALICSKHKAPIRQVFYPSGTRWMENRDGKLVEPCEKPDEKSVVNG